MWTHHMGILAIYQVCSHSSRELRQMKREPILLALFGAYEIYCVITYDICTCIPLVISVNPRGRIMMLSLRESFDIPLEFSLFEPMVKVAESPSNSPPSF